MPEDIIIKSIEENLKFEEMYLDTNDLIHVQPRDEVQEEEEIMKELSKKYTHVQARVEIIARTN